MDRIAILESLLLESNCEDDSQSDDAVDREIADLVAASGLQFTEAELHEFKFKAVRRRIVRGAEKLKKKLYRLGNKAKLKLAKVRYLKTAGAKRLKRLWKKMKTGASGGKLLASLKKRFGKRTMVRLVASMEEPDIGTPFTESARTNMPETFVERATAACLTAQTLALMGERFVEAKLFDRADEIATLGEAVMAELDKLHAGGTNESFDATFKGQMATWQRVTEAHDSDEFWDTYSDNGPFAAFVTSEPG